MINSNILDTRGNCSKFVNTLFFGYIISLEVHFLPRFDPEKIKRILILVTFSERPIRKFVRLLIKSVNDT